MAGASPAAPAVETNAACPAFEHEKYTLGEGCSAYDIDTPYDLQWIVLSVN